MTDSPCAAFGSSNAASGALHAPEGRGPQSFAFCDPYGTTSRSSALGGVKSDGSKSRQTAPLAALLGLRPPRSAFIDRFAVMALLARRIEVAPLT